MILNLVRIKAGEAHPKRLLKFLLPIFIGFLVSIIGQSSMPPVANALYFGTGYNAVVAGNAGGGNQNGVNACATDMVAVGVGLTVNGSSPGFGIYCSAIGADGQLVAQDQSSATNTTAVVGGTNKVFCPAGKVVTGVSFIIWSNVAIRCATPPSLSDNSALIWYSATISTPASTNCSANGIVAGFFTRTGAWTDAIGAYCLPYSLNTLSYNVNGGSGTAPSSQTQTAPAQLLTASSAYAGTRAGFHLDGWNTAANGLGTDYATGSSIRPIGATTLYAKWTSTITYNGNTNSGGAVPDPTVAVSSAALTNLAHNSGSLAKTGYYFAGWNTAANGSGTNYPASNPALITETPYMSFDATNFDDTTNAWTDGSGNSRSIPGTAVTNATTGSIRGNPTKVTNTAGTNGASKSFPAVQGTITDGIVLGNGALTNYTLCHVARYAGATRGRLFAGTTGNWLSGFWSGATGVAYHEGWITASTGTNDTNWKVQCDTGGSSSLLRSNGVLKSSVANSAVGLPANISINLHGSRSAPGETSDWAVAEVIIYDSVLSTTKIQEIEESLNRKYGVDLFTPTIHTYTYASTGDITLYAQWNSTITYNGNGQTSLATTVPAATIATGTAGNTTLAAPTTLLLTNFTFDGWNTAANGSGTSYAAGLTTYASTGSTTLYAQWKAPITFNGNTNSGGAAPATVNAITSTITLPSNSGNLTKTGYAFSGWNTAANGSGTTYAAGASYPVTAPATLYANWTPDNTGLTPSFNTNTNSAIGVLASTAYVINTAYTNNVNDLVLKDLPDKIQIIASVASGELAITTTTNLTLPTGYQAALNTAAAKISFIGNLADVNAALASLKYTAAATAASGTITVIAAYIGLAGTFRYNTTTPVDYSNLFPALTRTIAIGALATPAAPTLDATSDTGASSTDKKTKNNTPTINVGGLTVGATITLTATPASGTPVTCTFVATNTTGSCTFSTLADGTYSITAKQSLGGTTTIDSTALASVVIDTTAPTVTLTSAQVVSGGNLTSTVGIPSVSATITVTFSESVTDLTIAEIIKNAESTGWAITTTSFTTAAITSINFVATNSTGAGGTAGIARFSVGANSAYDVAGNGNRATASDFIINTLIQLSLTNEYQGSPLLSPVVVGNNAFIAQTTAGETLTLPGAGTLTRTGYTFAGWSLVTTNGSGTVVGTTFTPTVPVKLYSSWTPNVYVVTFNANGGNGSPTDATQSYSTGSSALSLTTKGTLARTGYTFAGWNTLTTGLGTNYLEGAIYTPTTSIILYAKWTAGTYAVTFNTNTGTGTAMTNLSITAGTTATLTANTYTKTGYAFAGWNTAADGTGNSYANSASVILYGNTTLYAQWTVVAPGAPSVTAATAGNTTAVVTVTGVTASGTTVGPATSFSVQAYLSDGTTVVTGKTCTVLASASPLSCEISGLTNGTTYKFIATAINTAGSKAGLISTVTAIPAPYVVTYAPNGGSVTPTTANYNLGTPLTLPLPTQSGYTFAGWYAESGLTTLVGSAGSSFSSPGATTLYARWTGIAYTITYNGNGNSSGTVPAVGTYSNGGTAYSVVGNTGTLVKTGYTFDGWYTTSSGIGGTAYAAASTYSLVANITLFAKWAPVARTVTYQLNGGTGTTPTQLTGKFIGDTFSTAASSGFSKSGFAFTGWNDATSTYAANTTYTVGGADVVLTAQWAAVSYSITYLANSGSGTPPTQANLNIGNTFTVEANTLTRTGYSFVAWNDGTANFAPGSTYTMSAANVSLIAQWTATGYTITYDGNGSDGGSAPTTGHYVTGGAPYSVALNTYTKVGYTFTGWKSAANTDYAPGAGYATSADLVLSAQWTPKIIAISYNINGGGGTPPATINWTYSATATSLDTGAGLTKTGYTFGGWATSANAATGVTTATPSSNVTYYAVWTPVTYTVTYSAGTGSGTVPTETGKTLGSSFTLAAGTSPLTPPAPSGEVTYSFGYWSEGATAYSAGSSFTMPARDITFTANWIAIYNVTYNANGGTTSIASEQKSDGAAITIGAAATRDGYNFTKWIDQSGGQWDPAATTTVTSGRYLFTASWTVIARTVTYDINGGSGSAPTTLTGKTIAQIITLDSTTATKAGYSFGGWLIGGVTYPAGASYTIGNANVAPVAVWNPVTYAISYNANGATSGTTPTSGTFTTGGSYSASANDGSLLKTGFTFVGWNTSANGSGTNYAVNATNVTTTTDLILYAKWSAASFAVTYVLNGASSTLPTQTDVQFGSTFQVAAAASQSGKVFTGWSDGTNTYGGGSTYTMGSAAITLTATWADQKYSITYLLNGGSGASAPTQVALSATDSFTVQTTTATKSGYSFAGWHNGSSLYLANTSYNMSTANVTLTAVWNVAVPGTPGTPTVSAGDGNATITVVAPSSGGTPTSYRVTASPGGATCTVISPATSCTITGLTNGTTYSFATVANNATGSSAASPSSASVSPAGKPGVPTGVTATIGNGSATVSLTPPTDTGGPAITSYTITASPGGATCTVNAPATSCVISPLTNGTAYTFTATAYNGVARSDASTASSAVTPATIPGAPTSVTSTSTTSGAATVTFVAPVSNGGSAITGYTITSSPGGFTCTAAASATSCVVSGLTNGTAYTFTALATNAVGNSTSSAATSPAITPQGAASAPTTVSAAVGDGQSVVTFSGAVTNGSTITNYTVKAYDSTGNVVATVTCSTSPCTVTGLTNGSAYTFKVETNSTVYDTTTASAPSVATNSITPATVPSAPTGVTATAGTNKITVAWSEPSANGSPITSYTVQAYDSTGTTPVVGATCTAIAPATTCDVSSSLVAGTNYTFKVTATSAAGTSAASSASSSAAINAAPSAPLSVTATAGNASATVAWNPPANVNGSAVTGYTVTAYTAGNVVAGTCTSTTQSCTVTGLTNGTAYTFGVTATNAIGTSVDSTHSSSVTPSTVPNAPTAVTTAAGDGTVTVSFTAPTNNGGSSVTGYTVTASNGSTISGTTSPLIISGLTNGTAYTFTVKATNINGDSVASATSASSTPVASSRPTLVNPGQPTGDPYVGSTLTSNVTFNGSPTPVITYQWKVCTNPLDLSTCTNISGATSATFTPTISELGKYIVVAETATNRVGTLTETSNPTLVINPEIAFTAPGSVPAGTVGSAYILSLAAAGGVGSIGYTVSNGTLPAGLTLNPTTGQISGTPTAAGTYTFTVRATDSNGVYKDVVVTIVVAAATTTPVVTTPVVTPPTKPPAPTCDSACQASKDAAATKAAADKAAADAAAKAVADAKAATDAAAAKAAANTAATNASTKAAADAAAAAAAAKAAVDKAAAAAVAQAAADAAAKAAAANAKAAADAQAAAAKAAADAAAALKNSTTTAAAKAAATASSNTAAAAAAAAVKAAATAAQQAVVAKTTAANATKQVDIAINSLTSKTAASQASAQANAIAAAAKAAANDAAAAAAAKAVEAKAAATTAQKAAADTAARIATEQKQAADAAAQAKIAADAAAKATADKVAADAVATKAAQDLAKVLADKAALAEQAAKTTDETARAEIQKKIDEVSTKVEEVQKSVEVATTKAEAATTVQVAATQNAESATKEAQTQAVEAVAVKTESVAKTAAATKAVAAATVAAKVAVAAKEAADKVPAKATIIPKPSTSTSKNSATATVTGLKPGQKVKVTVNVKDK